MATFFDSIADRWDELCCHDADKLHYILKQTTLHKGQRVLDVGCGTGVLESYLLPYAPSQIVGVDIAPQMIVRARSKYAVSMVDFRCLDVMELQQEKFDYIIAYSVFPHFPEPEKLIAHLADLLNPGGELVICHSEGRAVINSHHNKHASRMSHCLPTADLVSRWMMPYFSIRTLEDNDRLYIVSGVRNKYKK